MRVILAVLASILFTSYSHAKTITVDPDSPATLEINGSIGFQMVLPLVDKIVSQSKADHEITLIINSPGGEVNAGMYLLNAVSLAQARGTTFRCITSGLAASMAFQIFAKCDSRYALPNSFMLYHPVRVSVGGNPFEPAIDFTPILAKQLSDELARLEAFLIADLRGSMKVSDETFARNYYNETLLLAREVNVDSPKWLTLVDNIAGLRTITFGQPNKTEAKTTKRIRYMHICTVCR